MTVDVPAQIIALGRTNWSARWMNRQHLLSRLGTRGWPVVYSNGALSAWKRNTAVWRSAGWLGRFVERDGVQVDEPGRLLCRWPTFGAWDRFILRQQCARLRRVMTETHGADRLLALVFDPEFWPYVERLAPDYVAYHAYDAFSLMSGWTTVLEDYQEKLVARANLISVTSPGVAQQLPGDGPQRARLLLNGADTDGVAVAAKRPCPSDLAAIPRPRIGYVGYVNDKVDFALVAELARQRPNWNWVFVGPVAGVSPDESPVGAVPAWRGIPNIHLLGFKPKAQAPTYSAHMDVNTICYCLDGDNFASAGSPLKVYEYLGTGNPVVSVDLEVVRPLAPAVRIASGTRAWLDALDSALAEVDPSRREARREMALSNDWNRRVDTLEEWLREICR